MNFCAIIYGDSTNHARTLSSLKQFSSLSILHVLDLSKINFQDIQSDYTFFIKSGDALTQNAAQYLALNLTKDNPDAVYSDEAIIYGKRYKKFNFYKPDYSPELILSMNYFRNLLCIKTNLLKKIKQIESERYQNFLYELVLKSLPNAKVIAHIDEVLYHGFDKETKVSYQNYFMEFDQAAGRKLLENYCYANSIDASVLDGCYHGTFRIKYAIQCEPLVSIIIPFKDKPELLGPCIESILEKSTYKNFEIIGVNNGSQDKETYTLMNALEQKDKRVAFYDLDIPFNFSKINNYAANNFAKGQQLIFLNNDTEVIAPDWIEAMLEHSQQPQVGIVGAKLLYPDQTIQHCGMILGRLIAHIHKQLPDDQSGYFYFPHIIRNYHALTFACAMIKASLFKAVDGLDEGLAIACNDVDICARVSALGYCNVYTPYAVLYHYESKSRGMDETQEKFLRAEWEREVTAKRTPALFLRDSFYNKHLTENDTDFSDKIREDLKGFALLFMQRLRRRYREFGLKDFCRLIIKKVKR